MTIRAATIADVPELVDLAEREHGQSRFKDKKFDAMVSTVNMEQVVTGLFSRVFRSERGFIAGILQPSLFNRYYTAYELCWYAEDGCGMQLLKAFAAWAKKMRAVDLIVSNYAGMKADEKFTRVMRRAGFDLLGASYIQPLS